MLRTNTNWRFDRTRWNQPSVIGTLWSNAKKPRTNLELQTEVSVPGFLLLLQPLINAASGGGGWWTKQVGNSIQSLSGIIDDDDDGDGDTVDKQISMRSSSSRCHSSLHLVLKCLASDPVLRSFLFSPKSTTITMSISEPEQTFECTLSMLKGLHHSCYTLYRQASLDDVFQRKWRKKGEKK